MKRIGILFAFVLVVALLPAFIPHPVVAMTGSGTAEYPYMIYDVTDLQNMANDLDAYYELANDIDASVTVGWTGGAGFLPVGTWAAPFTGHFDGNGYTISDLHINRPSTDGVGLFGSIQALNGDILVGNVTLVEAAITGDEDVGVLAGTARGHITPDHTLTLWAVYVENSAVVGGAGGDYDGGTGGVVGELWGISEMSYCYYTGTVHGTGFDVGGLIGQATPDTTIRRCVAGAIVTQSGWGTQVGGLIGLAQSNLIEECYSAGSVDNTGAHKDMAYWGLGGFVGRASGSTADVQIIKNCYSRCDVTGKVGTYGEYVGGFIGAHIATFSTIINCYSTGFVTGGKYRGGFSASGGGCTACFWDMQTSGQPTSSCGTGKTTAEMKTESTFTSADWDFATIWDIGGAVNDGYPYLLWWYNPPTIISDVNQVVWFQPNDIIEGVILPNRAGGGAYQDGEFTWGANPAGIVITHGELIPEEEYTFEPIVPSSQDIIKPEPVAPTSDVDLYRLRDNPLYPLVRILVAPGFFTERLVWLGLAWFIVIVAMLAVHLGFDTHPDTEKPQHFVLTAIAGLGLSILFYTMGIFNWAVLVLMGIGLICAIIWERQPVI